MKQTVHHIHRSFWITLILILLLIAILFTTARLLTPFLANQRPLIERVASSFLSQPVKIGSLQITWHRFTPFIKSTDVVIFDDSSTHPLLRVNEMDLTIDLLQSLLDGDLEIGTLTISGANVTVQQTSDDNFIIKGIGLLGSAKSEANSLDEFIEWLFAAPQLSLQNININWYDKKNKLIPINKLDINLKNNILKHTIWGQAAISQQESAKLNFVIDIYGDSSLKTLSKANWFLQGKNILLSQFKDYPIKNYSFDSGFSNFKIWGSWQKGQLKMLHSLFTLDQATVVPVDTLPMGDSKGGERYSPPLVQAKALLSRSSKTGSHSRSFSAGMADQTKIIKADNPNPLFLSHVNGNVLWKSNNSWTIDATLNNLNYSRWQKIPGFTHLNTFFHITPQSGTAKLWGQNIQADFGPLFRGPLSLAELNTLVNWQQLAEGWSIQTEHAEVKTVDADVTGNMNLLIPADNSSPVINLLANMEMFGSKHLADYLPIGILSPGLVKWLEKSISSINKTNSTLILRGPVHSFPFDDNDGIFIVDSQLKDLNLDYYPGWPKATNISGNLVFRNRSMEMQIDQGNINSIPLKNIRVSIPLIKKNVLAMLNIAGNISTDLTNILQFIEETPLHKNGLSAVDNIAGSGPAQLQLQIAIPLEHSSIESTMAGQLALKNAQINIHKLPLQNFNGELTFTRHTVNAKNLTAVLWDAPLTLAITSPKNNLRLNFSYKDFQGNLAPINSSWLMNLQNPNMSGSIKIPNDPRQVIEANFQRLFITPGQTDNFSKIQPGDIPKINLTAEDVRYGNKKLGRLELQLNPTRSGLQISNLRVTAPSYNIAANGYWQLQNKQELTQLVGNLVSNNLSETLASLDFPTSISAKQTKLGFKLSWPGAAYNPELDILNGSFELQMQQGQITNLGPQAAMKMDIGRLLSILSFESITRRLKLDFSDVTGRGFPFDTIRGKFQLVNGNAYTRNLVVGGPIADVGIAGRIGLSAEDYDLMLNVTPKIGGSLTTLLGVAASPIGPVTALAFGPAGPAIGAAAWLAGKFVGGTINKIASDTYHMTGSWAQPKIIQVGNFFTKSPKK